MFSSNGTGLQNLSSRTSMRIGTEHNGFYLLKEVDYHRGHSVLLSKSGNKASINVDSNVWHLRLGYLPVDRLRLLKIDYVMDRQSMHCDLCPIAKQSLLPFPRSNTMSKVVLILFIWT